ncbi:hypothetical protein [Gottfriedia acidiceleris]|uniref:Lipoprotein n=1 Tax=Gottfriedia acidiceleris TaxID=371036 RepID=A0ABY4JFG0_9BACI|nr:hypothetical protein [Gottfriedia acidiceleris]UPM52571.1 hypothetical protein MY490_12040 [Gottfriedia acidiceleris]
MKKFKMVCLLTLATVALSACTIKKPPQNLDIKPDGSFDQKSIGIKVESSLPKNAKFNILFKNDDTQKIVYETTIKTDNNGNANKKILLDSNNKNLTGFLFFKPEEQPKTIQDKFGKYGENIRSNTKGYTVGKRNNQKYIYIKLYGTFLKFGKLSNQGFIFFDKEKLKQNKEGK